MENIPTIPAKSIVLKTKSPSSWFGLDYNMNIYRGCSHGCIYCDSRSECYGNIDFETVKVKENAIRIIRDDLRRKSRTGVVASGSMSDPYNPLEKKLKLTRSALEMINAYGFGASICTKSALVTRDTDILRDVMTHSPTIVIITVTTADDELCKKLEPNVSLSSERFEALRILAGNGVYCGLLLMPVLPFLTDTGENIVNILRMAKEAGARFVYTYMGMTLRKGNREYYYDQLDRLFPQIKDEYIQRYDQKYSCTSPGAKNLWSIFTTECKKLGLLYSMKEIISSYKAGYGDGQMSLY